MRGEAMQINKEDIIVVVKGKDTNLTTILSSSKECLLDIYHDLSNTMKSRTKYLWILALAIVINVGCVVVHIAGEDITIFNLIMAVCNGSCAYFCYFEYRRVEIQEQISMIATQEIYNRIKEMN